MSNEIKAALHVAMEAIDAKLRHTGLKPGHENDLRAAKGVLRSMISNLPAASGQKEPQAEGWALSDVIEALRASGFEVRGEDAAATVYGTVEAGAVLLDASIEVFSQQENKGLELPDDHPISVHLRGLGIEPAAHPAPAQQESEPKPKECSGDPACCPENEGYGSHCSCHGLAGKGYSGDNSAQWEPEETTVEALEHRLVNGSLGSVGGYDGEGYAAQSRQVVDYLKSRGN